MCLQNKLPGINLIFNEVPLTCYFRYESASFVLQHA